MKMSRLYFFLAVLLSLSGYHLAVGMFLLTSMLSLPFSSPLTVAQQLRIALAWPELIAVDFYANRYHAAEIEQLQKEKAKP